MSKPTTKTTIVEDGLGYPVFGQHHHVVFYVRQTPPTHPTHDAQIDRQSPNGLLPQV
jgi:hypothetical protein